MFAILSYVSTWVIGESGRNVKPNRWCYKMRVRGKLKLISLIFATCVICFGCSRQHIQPMKPFTFGPVTLTPVQDAYYRRFPPAGKGPYLEEPRSCDSLLSYDGTLHVMPDAMLKRIADGKGLPKEYYRSHRVPANYCRPSNHVWTFPESHEQFFDALPVTYQEQHLSYAEVRVIENIKHSLPGSARNSLKWTKTGSSLEVFRLQPGAFSAGDYFAYKLINESNAYINPNTGEYIPVPGP